MCHLYPYKNVKLLWKFFYINICGFISSDKVLYDTRVLDNSYLRFKVQLPTSDSTEITAGGPKVTEGPIPLDPPSVKITLGGPAPPAGTPLTEIFYTQIE